MSISLLIGFLISVSAGAQTITIGVIGDLNGTECQTQYPSNTITAFENLLSKHKLDHLISTGDTVHGECPSYKGSTPYATVVKSMWTEFDKRFTQRARAVQNLSFTIAPGNHDAPYLSSSSRETFKAENGGFVNYWQGRQEKLDGEPLRLANAADNYPYYWAYTHQNVLYVVLQSTREHTLSNAEAQKAWLREVLNSTEAKRARARIVFGHIPPYAVLDPSVGSKYLEILDKEQVGVKGGLMDLLIDNGVDLLVMGHSHAPYPAVVTRTSDKKRIKILSMPCAHAPRKLFSKGAAAPRGYAVVQLNDQNQVAIELRNWSDDSLVPNSYFPANIPTEDLKVTYQRMPEGFF